MIGGLSRKGSEEEFRFWSKLDVDFMMLSVPFDFFFDEVKVRNVIDLKNKFKLNLLIHPRPDGEKMLSPANPESHNDIFNSLEIIKKLIREQNLINKVIIHLSTYKIPGTSYATFTEEEAIINSAPFYKKLKCFTGFNLVLENAYPPGIGWEELGYLPEHFQLFNLRDDYEFCLDTGHFNLCNAKIEDFIDLPFKLTCLHLHSNNGKKDQHLPLTKKNFKHWKIVENILSKEKYTVIEVKNQINLIENSIPHLRLNKICP